jgi:DNA-binding XRE family transcriptional regulator
MQTKTLKKQGAHLGDRRLNPKQPQPSGREQLENWIVRRRMTQEEAAQFVGLSRPRFNQILNGVRRPGLEAAVRLEDATGISIRSWLCDTVPDRESTDLPQPTAAGHSNSGKQH